MNSLQFLTEASPFFIAICLLAGVLYAGLLYYRSTSYTAFWRISLAICRGLLVSIIAFLLLNPFLRMFENKEIKPLLVFLADDSESMTIGTPKVNLSQEYSQFLAIARNLAQKTLPQKFEHLMAKRFKIA